MSLGPFTTGGAGTGLAVSVRLALPVRGPCRHPPAAGHPGGARVGTADGLCQEHPGTPSLPGHPGGPGPARPSSVLPEWVQGDRLQVGRRQSLKGSG